MASSKIQESLEKFLKAQEDILFLGGTMAEQNAWLHGFIASGARTNVCPDREVWYINVNNADESVYNLSALPGTPNFGKEVPLTRAPGDDDNDDDDDKGIVNIRTGLQESRSSRVTRQYLRWVLRRPKPVVAVLMYVSSECFETPQVTTLFEKCKVNGHVMWFFGTYLPMTMSPVMVSKFDAFFFRGVDQLHPGALAKWKSTFLIDPAYTLEATETRRAKAFADHLKFFNERFEDYKTMVRQVVKLDYAGETHDHYPMMIMNLSTKGFGFHCVPKKEALVRSSKLDGIPADVMLDLLKAALKASSSSSSSSSGEERKRKRGGREEDEDEDEGEGESGHDGGVKKKHKSHGDSDGGGGSGGGKPNCPVQ